VRHSRCVTDGASHQKYPLAAGALIEKLVGLWLACAVDLFDAATGCLTPVDDTSFFVNLLGLYSGSPAQAGYGDKWPSE
jgi:hypothetical protein